MLLFNGNVQNKILISIPFQNWTKSQSIWNDLSRIILFIIIFHILGAGKRLEGSPNGTRIWNGKSNSKRRRKYRKVKHTPLYSKIIIPSQNLYFSLCTLFLENCFVFDKTVKRVLASCGGYSVVPPCSSQLDASSFDLEVELKRNFTGFLFDLIWKRFWKLF